MTDKTNAPAENPPAFPNTGNSNWNLQPCEGMSLRDWFAGQALARMMQRDDAVLEWPYNSTASHAYELADAMLEARDRHD